LVSDIVGNALTDTLNTLDLSSRYSRLLSLLLGRFDEIKVASVEDTECKVDDYVERNKFSQSQNDDMFETIVSLQTRGRKRQLKVALGLEGSSTTSSMNITAIESIVHAVFESNNQVPLNEYLATSKHGLEAYGNVLKRIFIHDFPSLALGCHYDTLKAVERSLCGVSDDDLKRAMKDSDEFQCDYERKTEELKELN
jgi:hypothetical protein